MKDNWFLTGEGQSFSSPLPNSSLEMIYLNNVNNYAKLSWMSRFLDTTPITKVHLKIQTEKRMKLYAKNIKRLYIIPIWILILYVYLIPVIID
jgi:hypothetical protein